MHFVHSAGLAILSSTRNCWKWLEDSKAAQLEQSFARGFPQSLWIFLDGSSNMVEEGLQIQIIDFWIWEFAMGPWHGSGPGGIACGGVLRVLWQAMCCPTAMSSKVHTGSTGCSTLIDLGDVFCFLLPLRYLRRHLFSNYWTSHIF